MKNPQRHLSIAHRFLSRFVPKHDPVLADDVWRFQEFLHDNPKLLCLTGAGISTESGIPDYRSEGVGLYATSKSRPVQFKDFMASANIRQRYWARNYYGWPRFSSLKPNASHLKITDLESNGLISCIVTQNVDRLHTKAGSSNVVELHGTAYEVKCMQCENRMDRDAFQRILNEYNDENAVNPLEIRPDADVELTQVQIDGFYVPPCPSCSGILKPDIVFFGDNVPRPRVEKVFDQLDASDGLLVLGSSLHAFSGYRFALRAKELCKPIAILNIGPTRADHLASVKISGRLSEVLGGVLI